MDTITARITWASITLAADPIAHTFTSYHGHDRALELIAHDDEALTTALIDASIDPSGHDTRSSVTRWRTYLPHAERTVDAALHADTTAVAPSALPGLSDLETPPHVLFVRGNIAALTTQNATTTTGARASSAYGDHIASTFASDLTKQGHTIVTGAGYGIDAAATRAALAAGGAPVVILASGADLNYPAGHADLFDTIISAGGAIVSEHAPGTIPTRQRFIARARLLAASSHRTLIPESSPRGGATLVAMAARSLGRPVYAIPGPITNAGSNGPHELIRAGHATAVTDAMQL